MQEQVSRQLHVVAYTCDIFELHLHTECEHCWFGWLVSRSQNQATYRDRSHKKTIITQNKMSKFEYERERERDDKITRET